MAPISPAERTGTPAARRPRPATAESCRPVPPLADDRSAEIATLFKALAHPARVAIVATLARCPGACCGEIVDCLPLAQSTVSQHLAVLREAGLVTMCDEGRTCRYGLAEDAAERLAQAAGLLFPQAGHCGEPLVPGCPEVRADAQAVSPAHGEVRP